MAALESHLSPRSRVRAPPSFLSSLDSLYHAAPHVTAGTPAPPFPFERQRIGVSPSSVVGAGASGQVGTRWGSVLRFDHTQREATL